MIRLAVRVRREQAELALAELLELAPSGVEEVELGSGLVEYAVYGAPGELPALPDLRAAVGGALVEISSREIADDWAERWRQFHRPLVLGGRLAVRPPWEPAIGEPVEVVIDPGRAFGTGAHPTTRLCLEMLLELGLQARARGGGQGGGAPAPTSPIGAKAVKGSTAAQDESAGPNAVGGSTAAQDESAGPNAVGGTTAAQDATPSTGGTPVELIDVGCGSGVLAIVAAKLGFGPVLALDHDPAAVAAARANAEINGVAIEVRRHDLRLDPVPRASVALANLLGPLLLGWASRMTQTGASERPGWLIAGGLLACEADRIADAFADAGLHEQQRRRAGEWAALALRRD